MSRRLSNVVNCICGAILLIALTVFLIPSWIDHWGTPALRSAASENDADSLRWLTRIGVDLDTRDAKQKTALHLAAQAGSLEAVTLLLEANAIANLRDEHGKTPLHWAVWANHTEVAKRLLERPGNYDPQHPRDATLIHLAAANGNHELARRLIQLGADVNLPATRYRYRPIHRAVDSGDLATVQLLVAHGVELDVRDGRGRTPLSIARYRGHQQVTEFLMTAKLASLAPGDTIRR